MLDLCSPLTNGLEQENFNTDFKVWLQAEEIFYSDIEFEEQLEMVELLTGANPRQILDFLKCGHKEIELNSDTNKAEEREVMTRPYSYIYDWQLIYSAFFEQYKIDLIDADLHYWKFKALFNNLHDTIFNKVLEFRMIDLSTIKDKETRTYYSKMKQQYELPTEKERRRRIREEFDKL